MLLTPKNSRGRPVTKLCLGLETFRRTDEGRFRDAKAFLGHFFPTKEGGATDRLFVHLPSEVRADLLSNWGIRGKKSALRDDDEKVRTTVVDALAAGDIDATIIEEGITAEILIDWVPLEHWWSFWRGALVPLASIRRALALSRDLALFDDRWFLDSLKLPGQKLEKTEVLCAGLGKEQLVAWMHAVHESGDATPAGLVRALGWETVLTKTAEAALGSSLDALARQIGLATAQTETPQAAPPKSSSPSGGYPKVTHPQKSAPNEAAIPKDTTSAVLKAERPSQQMNAVRPLGAPIAAPLPGPAPARAPTAGALSPRPIDQVPSVVVALESSRNLQPTFTESAVPPAPTSSPPTARALFGSPKADLPPMRPPATTLTGVGGPTPLDEQLGMVSLSLPTTQPTIDDPAWAPPRAEPGDMGWDLVHGVTMSISNIQPKYNFEDDDEPTGDIVLPRDQG